MNDGTGIHQFELVGLFAKVHQVAQINRDITLCSLRYSEDPFCTIVPAGGHVKDFRRIMLQQKQRLHTARELLDRNHAQHLTVNCTRTQYDCLIDVLYLF